MFSKCGLAFLPLLMALPMAANAAPPIAYISSGGSANEVWLVNADGSGAKRIYSASSKIPITFIDLRPGGGQVAIVENRNSVRLINYDAAGVPTGTISVPVPTGCQIAGLDYHPSDSSILYSQTCAGGTDLRIER